MVWLTISNNRFETTIEGSSAVSAPMPARELRPPTAGPSVPSPARRPGPAHSEARLMALFDSAMDGIVTIDGAQRIVMFNKAAERMFRCPASTALGQPITLFVPERFRAHHARHVEAFGATGTTVRQLGRGGAISALRADGEEFPIEASISQVDLAGQKLYTVILRDITERVRAEAALLRYQNELSELTRRLMRQEKETTRQLAQALHDQLGQTLTAIRLAFDAAPAGSPSAAVDRPRERLDRLIDQAIREVRQVLVELRPPLLDDHGLAAALDNELQSRDRRLAGVDLLLEVEPDVARLRWPADIEHAAFMVAREATSNALRHARASLVRVVLAGGARHLRLEVVDDGRGWPRDAQNARPGHLGVVGMRERALAIGASFTVEPNPEGGTLVCLAWEDVA